MKTHLLIITLPLLLLFGCSSVNQPVASTDLVQTGVSQLQEPIEQNLIDLLNRNSEEFNTTLGDEAVTIYPPFFSATGDSCRYILQQNSKKLYCSNDSRSWRLITPVLAELSYD